MAAKEKKGLGTGLGILFGEEEYNALEPDENGKRVYKTPWYEDEIIITPDSMTGKSGEGMHNDVYVLKVRNHKQL